MYISFLLNTLTMSFLAHTLLKLVSCSLSVNCNILLQFFVIYTTNGFNTLLDSFDFI